MNTTIMLFLVQDGITNGAIYALLGLALVLVFAVTRVVFVPQGEFVAFGTLTLAALQNGTAPRTLWLLVGMAVLATLMEVISLARRDAPARSYAIAVALWLLLPTAIAAAVWWLAPMKLALPWQVVLAVLSVTALGPLVYRIAIQPVAQASVYGAPEPVNGEDLISSPDLKRKLREAKERLAAESADKPGK